MVQRALVFAKRSFASSLTNPALLVALGAAVYSALLLSLGEIREGESNFTKSCCNKLVKNIKRSRQSSSE